MPSIVCLQGGGEFSVGCREMDAELVRDLDGPVVVTALAGEVGTDYRRATDNGVRHFRLLAEVDVVAAPDVRVDPDGALAALRLARLIVLPGGSPRRLLRALTSTDVGAVVAELLATGGRVMGASAGAMVLGPWTVLPETSFEIAPGLGLVPFVVVPHWKGEASRWVQAVPAKVAVLGIPEESGVLFRSGVLTGVGQASTRLVRQARDLPVAESWSVA